jgi:hypothetical protein
MKNVRHDDDLENKPGVFIIESFSFDEEEKNSLPGYHLYQSLSFCNINDYKPLYYFIRTKIELAEVLNKFEDSNYEFLHIFCHGSSTHIELALENIAFEELYSITEDRLFRKRLFLSSCNLAQFDFAKLFIPRVHCKSIIGSQSVTHNDIEFLVWSSFYYQMLETGNTFMKQKNIIQKIKDLTKLYGIELTYFSIINSQNPKSIDSLRILNISKGEIDHDKVLKTPFEKL